MYEDSRLERFLGSDVTQEPTRNSKYKRRILSSE